MKYIGIEELDKVVRTYILNKRRESMNLEPQEERRWEGEVVADMQGKDGGSLARRPRSLRGKS